MNKSGPIIIIEDDLDDQNILKDIFKDLSITNELIFFKDGVEVLNYISSNELDPFLIISDVNMPKLNGFELREEINESALSKKNIPFLLFTTAAGNKAIEQAYSKPIQGFFIKPGSYSELETTFRNIINYWKMCISQEDY